MMVELAQRAKTPKPHFTIREMWFNFHEGGYLV